MKPLKKLFSIIGLLFFISAISPDKIMGQGVSVNFQIFYDELSPYGQWVESPNYGYVWIPAIGNGFSPYSSGGHWVYTEYGWTWVSDYPWGWAPFHYGRWDFNDGYGWFWVPDVEWAPAWVAWRRSPGYYGWTPLSPGVSLEVSFNNNYYGRRDNWFFVEDRYLGRRDINQHYAPRTNNETIINNSTVINKTYIDNSRHTTYVTGPDKEEVQKVTGTPVQPVTIKESSKPAQSLSNDQLNIYRPRVSKTTNEKVQPAPAKVIDIKDVKPVEKNQGDQNQNAIPPPSNQTPAEKNQRGQRNPAKNNSAQPVDNQRHQNMPTKPQENVPAKKNQQAIPQPAQQNQDHERGEQNKNRPAQPQESAPTQQNPQPPAPIQQEPNRGRTEQQNRPTQPQENAPPKQNPSPSVPVHQDPSRGRDEQQQNIPQRPQENRQVDPTPPANPPKQNSNPGAEQPRQNLPVIPQRQSPPSNRPQQERGR
jgi:hypothetical protein